jgi:hypothetical protein
MKSCEAQVATYVCCFRWCAGQAVNHYIGTKFYRRNGQRWKGIVDYQGQIVFLAVRQQGGNIGNFSKGCSPFSQYKTLVSGVAASTASSLVGNHKSGLHVNLGAKVFQERCPPYMVLRKQYDLRRHNCISVGVMAPHSGCGYVCGFRTFHRC